MDDLDEDSLGFSLNFNKFVFFYNFSFHDTLLTTLTPFDEGIPEIIIPRGPHIPRELGHKCPVCGSSNHDLILDLGNQPLANDFHNDSKVAFNSKRYPLQLMRCRSCYHYHLLHLVDRSQLFENYLYQSGTSNTLNDYFLYLAKKVTDEVEIHRNKTTLSVLEIACNDGTQLNHFKALGWKTYGVDPAQNLITIAKSQSHTVSVGFWPSSDFHGLQFTAIVAQNVLAHVPNVITFLKGCAKVMTAKTKLYIQTSQCNMHQLGQIDLYIMNMLHFSQDNLFTGLKNYQDCPLLHLKLLQFMENHV
jgi:SAM-dependent methyltransferase